MESQPPHTAPTILTCTIGADNIIYLTMGGNIRDTELVKFNDWANEVRGAMVAVSQSSPGRVHTLIDVTTVSGFDVNVVASLQSLMQFNRKYATRTAVFGANPIVSAVTYSAIVIARRFTTMKLFATRAEAMKWLLAP